MTRKDYELIAAAVKECRSTQNQAYYGLWCADDRTLDTVAGVLAEKLAADNPRFDRERFLQACGVQS